MAARAALANRQLILDSQVAAIMFVHLIFGTIFMTFSEERARVYSLLAKYDWISPHLGSQANFILCKINQVPAFLLAATLRKKGILVRHYSNPRLMHHVRFSIGRPAETNALIKALDRINEDVACLTRVYLSEVDAILWDMDGLLPHLLILISYRRYC